MDISGWHSLYNVNVTHTFNLGNQHCQQTLFAFFIRQLRYAIKFLPICKIVIVFWHMQPGSNFPTRVTWTISLEKYNYFVSCRPGLPRKSTVFFYKNLSYSINYPLKFFTIVILDYANWQHWAPPCDTLHVFWTLQILCISGPA